jgi:hypothetical protein
MDRAEASFTIDRWEEQVAVDAPRCKLVRTTIGKTFRGDIEGTSLTEAIMATASERSMSYAAFERLEVAVRGRRGTFVLHHDASMGAGHAWWIVLHDSGTGELAGISGRATITRHEDGRHELTLDYELPG